MKITVTLTERQAAEVASACEDAYTILTERDGGDHPSRDSRARMVALGNAMDKIEAARRGARS